MKLRNKNGFSILAVILVIVAVIVAIGIWSLSGKSNATNSNNSSYDVQATTIINDSANIKLAYDKLVINGALDTSIIFKPNTASTPTAPNMLDPINGISVPNVNPKSIRNVPSAIEGYWVYSQGLVFRDIGTGLHSPVVMISGVKYGVCQRINKILFGSDTVPFLFNTGMRDSDFIAGTTPDNPQSTLIMDEGFSPFFEIAGQSAGCFLTASPGGDPNNPEGNAVFFRILKAR